MSLAPNSAGVVARNVSVSNLGFGLTQNGNEIFPFHEAN